MNSKSSSATVISVEPRGAHILGSFIDACSWRTAIYGIHRWSAARESRYVCICNVHSLVTARQNESLHNALAGADMSTPDGMPIAWMLRRMGFPNQQRINGPDLMWNYCELAESLHEPVFLYGATQATLSQLQLRLQAAFPQLPIAGIYSPPFRALTAAEDEEIIAFINASGARVVFISLGCPKQELWMAQHRGKIKAVMVGVGAAFDYHAGTLQRAPLWMQQRGLEWLHRFYSEPRRLWKRYLVTNAVFVLLSSIQLIIYKRKNRNLIKTN